MPSRRIGSDIERLPAYSGATVPDLHRVPVARTMTGSLRGGPHGTLRRGAAGETATGGGARVSKTDLRVEAKAARTAHKKRPGISTRGVLDYGRLRAQRVRT